MKITTRKDCIFSASAGPVFVPVIGIKALVVGITRLARFAYLSKRAIPLKIKAKVDLVFIRFY